MASFLANDLISSTGFHLAGRQSQSGVADHPASLVSVCVQRLMADQGVIEGVMMVGDNVGRPPSTANTRVHQAETAGRLSKQTSRC